MRGYPNINLSTIPWIDIDYNDEYGRVTNHEVFKYWREYTVVLLRTQFNLPVIAYLRFGLEGRHVAYFVHPYNRRDSQFNVTGCVKLNGYNKQINGVTK